MTNISGYFNANPWPLILWISELNQSIQVAAAPPNQYIVDDRGNRVNDPLLEKYCGPKMLSRELSPTPVPLVSFVARTPNFGDERRSPVSTAKTFEKGKDGRTVAVPLDQPASPPPSVPMPSTNPVKGLTMEQARAMGLIRPTKQVPEDFGAPETNSGVPSQGQAIPEIEYATDLGPRAARAARQQQVAPLPAAATASVIPQNRAVVESLQQAATVETGETVDVGALSRQVRAGGSPPAPALPAVGDLPEPVLEEEAPPLPTPTNTLYAAPVEAVKPRLPFLCLRDQKDFASREQLLLHVSQNYPDQVDELMEPYPAVPKRRPRQPVPPPPAEG